MFTSCVFPNFLILARCAFAMRSHQDIGSQGHGAQIRRYTESDLKDLHKLQEMLTVREDQGASQASEYGLSEATASTGPISGDHVQRLRSGEACDSRRPVIVGAGAGSRSFPSMTKLSNPARRWKQFAAPDLHTELAVQPPSPPSPATEGSVTAVAQRRHKHSHVVALEVKPNPIFSCQTFPDQVTDSTVGRSQYSETSPTTISSPVDTSRARSQANFAVASQFGELESTNATSHGDHAQLHKKQRLNGSSGCGFQSAGTVGAAVENAAEAVAQAAAALLMLSSDENMCPSSSSSSSAGRPFSWTGATNGEDISVEGGQTSSRNSGDEDATAGSVLSRPLKKRRYRLIVDLLAETPRILRGGDDF